MIRMMDNNVAVVVLAAGHGKRMGVPLPKVLVPYRNEPLIMHLLRAIQEAQVCERPVIVVGQGADQVKQVLGNDYTYVLQTEQLGTGHAVAAARAELEGKVDHVVVLYGDQPLIQPSTIRSLVAAHMREQPVLTMATVTVEDFEDWRVGFNDFGRIVRDESGKLCRIVERKDAIPEELAITEVNPSYFCFQADWLWQNLQALKNDNSQGEYYLTDLAALACTTGAPITTVPVEPREAMGVNTKEQLQLIEE
jgi:bifunctional UDP-N-acetylglucosamine pyrophosphorylase / glucosamine-1-phosphate N-acetyltransferase